MIASLLIVLAGAPVLAAPAPDTSTAPRPVLVLPEVRVERKRPGADAQRRLPTGFVSDVRAGSTGHALETVADLLTRAATVRIQQYGGLGAFSTVSLRGAPANQVSVYLDGAPFQSAAQSVMNLADLPATAVERIEVYRGLSPLELGPVTPGGAINLVTMPAASTSRVSLAHGSFGIWEGSATGAASRGRWSALLHGGYQGTDGDFSYWDDNGTPQNLADDGTSLRVNNRFDAGTLLGTGRGRLGLGVDATLRASWFRKTQGVPGLGASQAVRTALELTRESAQLELERRGTRSAPAIRGEVALDRSGTRFQNPVPELGTRAYDTDDVARTERYLVASSSPRLPGGLTAQGTASLRNERFDAHDAKSPRPDPPSSRRETRGASLELRLEPWGDPVLLAVGRRWDRQQDALRWVNSLGVPGRSDVARELDSPQLRARLRPGRGFELKANWGRAARSPEMVELFGNEGSVLGNPTLSPEHAETWDAGVGWASTSTRLVRFVEWAHYETHAHDLIAYARASASSVRARNVSSARIRGEELRWGTDLGRSLSASGWLAWQTTIDLGPVPAWHGRRLPQRPERHVFAEAGWRIGPCRLGGDVEHIGENYLDPANRTLAPARTLVGASLSVRPRTGLAATLEGKNLGDARASDVAGFPLPGRSLFVSLTLGSREGAGPSP